MTGIPQRDSIKYVKSMEQPMCCKVCLFCVFFMRPVFFCVSPLLQCLQACKNTSYTTVFLGCFRNAHALPLLRMGVKDYGAVTLECNDGLLMRKSFTSLLWVKMLIMFQRRMWNDFFHSMAPQIRPYHVPRKELQIRDGLKGSC